MTATSISATYMKKAETIKKIIEIGGRLNILINDKVLKRTLRKRISEYDKVQSNNFIRDPNELHTVLCLNSTQRLWEDVTDEIILCHNSTEKPSPIAWDQLLEISDTILSKVVTKVSELDIKSDTDACIHQITRLMPTMYVSNSFGGVFINLHEFVYVPGALEYLLSPDDDENKLGEETEDPEDVEVTETNLQSGNKEKGGQPPLIKQFPDIVNIVVEFVKQQGYAAQHRRRDETVYSSGVTISQIREYLFQQIPGLREYGISKSTIRRLFNPPPPPPPP